MQRIHDLTTLTDECLLQRITEGDKQTLVVLFDRYAADLYSYVLRHVRACPLKKQKPEDIAQNILMDIFTSLWDDRNTLSIAVTLRAYLFAGVHNRAIDYLCHRKDYSLRSTGRQKISTGSLKSAPPNT